MNTASRQYELIYIAPPDSSEQQLAELQSLVDGIVTRFSGKLDNTENWGRRRLAYEVGRHKEGVYVLQVLTGPGEMVRELDRRLRVSDQVIRHLVVRVDEDLAVAARRKQERRSESDRRRAARGLPPQPEGPQPPRDESGREYDRIEETEVSDA